MFLLDLLAHRRRLLLALEHALLVRRVMDLVFRSSLHVSFFFFFFFPFSSLFVKVSLYDSHHGFCFTSILVSFWNRIF